jgi:hypothetical protein
MALDIGRKIKRCGPKVEVMTGADRGQSAQLCMRLHRQGILIRESYHLEKVEIASSSRKRDMTEG